MSLRAPHLRGEAISGSTASTWIFTRDCFVAEAPRNDKLNYNYMSDFQQTVDLRGKMERQKSASPAGRPAAPPAKKPITPLEKIYQDEDEIKPRADLKKISQPKAKEPRGSLVRPIVFILAFLIIGFTVYSLFFKEGGRFNKPAEAPVWYAVTLKDNGLIYYGLVMDISADPVVIKNVYYNYDQKKAVDEGKPYVDTGSLRLVKQGNENYGPESISNVYQSNISKMDPLKADSKVLQAILNYEK